MLRRNQFLVSRSDKIAKNKQPLNPDNSIFKLAEKQNIQIKKTIIGEQSNNFYPSQSKTPRTRFSPQPVFNKQKASLSLRKHHSIVLNQSNQKQKFKTQSQSAKKKNVNLVNRLLAKLQSDKLESKKSKELSKKNEFFSEEKKKKTEKNAITTYTSIGIDKTKPKKRDLDDYMLHIQANDQQHYGHSQNYQNIRNLSKKEYCENFDLRLGYMVENIFFQVYQNLKNSRQIKTRQYCMYYLSIREKFMLETNIIANFLKGFQSKLRLLFTYQRLCCFFVCVLIQSNIMFQRQYITNLRQMFYQVHSAYSIVIQVAIETIDGHSGKTPNTDAFKILKNICQIETACDRINNQLKGMQQIINNRMKYATKDMIEIERSLILTYERNHQKSNFEEKLYSIENHLNWKFLRIPPIPFLPNKNFQQNNNKFHPSQYTLVLDLDQTLVYYNQDKKILKFRPHLLNFLETLSPLYEIVIFTASTKEYADKIINEIDKKKNLIKYRLYREHLRVESARLLKDITKLGRRIEKTIIIDNIAENFRNCLENGISIDTWEGDKNDEALLNLLPLLTNIVQNKIEDIREYFKNQKITLTHISEENEQSLITIK